MKRSNFHAAFALALTLLTVLILGPARADEAARADARYGRIAIDLEQLGLDTKLDQGYYYDVNANVTYQPKSLKCEHIESVTTQLPGRLAVLIDVTRWSDASVATGYETQMREFATNRAKPPSNDWDRFPDTKPPEPLRRGAGTGYLQALRMATRDEFDADRALYPRASTEVFMACGNATVSVVALHQWQERYEILARTKAEQIVLFEKSMADAQTLQARTRYEALRWLDRVLAVVAEKGLCDAARPPIIFIPGVAGSKLEVARDPNALLQPMAGTDLWPLAPAADRARLMLDATGTDPALGKTVRAPEIVDYILEEPEPFKRLKDYEIDVYRPFQRFFESIGRREGEDLWYFPYDWRYDNEEQLDLLDKVVDEARGVSGSEKVVLISHSMGGLVAKGYIHGPGRAKVETYISIALPYHGGAIVLSGIADGYLFGNSTARQELMKILEQNWPAAYQLLPRKPIVWDLDNNRLLTRDEMFSIHYRGFLGVDTGIVMDTYTETPDHPWTYNRELLRKADTYHTRFTVLQTRKPLPLPPGVTHYAIVGYGCWTPSWYIMRNSRPGADKTYRFGDREVELKPQYDDGDGTVPIWSADFGGADYVYYVQNGEPGKRVNPPAQRNLSAEHTGLVGNDRVHYVIEKILAGDPPRDNTYQAPSTLWDVAGERVRQGSEHTAFVLQSNAFMEIVDVESGRHVGPDTQTRNHPEAISGGAFDLVGGGEFAVVPGVDRPLRVVVTGTSPGAFSLSIGAIREGDYREFQFPDVTVDKGTVATLEFRPSEAFAAGTALPALHWVSAGMEREIPAQDLPRGSVIGGLIAPALPPAQPGMQAGTAAPLDWAQADKTLPEVVTLAESEPTRTEPNGPAGPLTPIGVQSGTRTFVYHQVTSFGPETRVLTRWPVLSDDGGTILFAAYQAPQPIYVLSTDGSGLRQIGEGQSSSIALDVSADGSLVLVNDSYRIRVIPTDNSGEREIYRHGGGYIGHARLTGDGQTVFYTVYVGNDRGVYRIGIDGRGRRRIVSPEKLAALIHVQADNVHVFNSNGWTLDASHDGSRLVFAAHNRAWGITPAGGGMYTVQGDGSELQRILGPLDWVHAVGISGDGRRVGYIVQHPGQYHVGGVIDANGSNDRVLAEVNQLAFGGSSVPTSPINLSADGSSVLLGGRSILFASDGSAATSIGTPFGHRSRFSEGLYLVWASADMNRFVFVIRDEQGRSQLAMMFVDPDILGAAPRLSDLSIQPLEVTRGTQDYLRVLARPEQAPETLLISTSCAFYKDGTYTSHFGSPNLSDAGSAEDGEKGDGLYGVRYVRPSSDSPLGPYTVRIKAESRDARNMAHATAVEFDRVDIIDLDGGG